MTTVNTLLLVGIRVRLGYKLGALITNSSNQPIGTDPGKRLLA